MNNKFATVEKERRDTTAGIFSPESSCQNCDFYCLPSTQLLFRAQKSPAMSSNFSISELEKEEKCNQSARKDHDQHKEATIFWARWIATRPKICFGVTFTVQILFIVVTILLYNAGYDILPAVFEDLPMASNSEPMYLRQQAWEHRFDDFSGQIPKGRDSRSVQSEASLASLPELAQNELEHFEGAATWGLHEMETSMSCFPFALEDQACVKKKNSRIKRDVIDDEDFIHARELNLGSLSLIYEVPDDVFTQENLRTMAQLEYDFYFRDDFQFRFCKLSMIAGALNCEQFISILRLFDGSFAQFNEELFDPSFTNISNVLYHAFTTDNTKDLVKSFFAKDAFIDLENRQFSSAMTRTTIMFGFPLEEYSNQTDNRLQQRKVLRRWLREDIVPLLKEKKELEDNNVSISVSYFSPALYFDEALVAIKVEWTMILGAILFNFLFMWFQTGSLCITCFGVFSIICSFVGANLVYRVVIGYRYFGYFNILALFILLGIGADDIFILVDTWKISLLSRDYSKLEARISAVFKRSAVAMFVTSLTSMTAFFVSSFSPLLPIASFGTFAGVAVLINYISVITFLPCVVVIHHMYLEKTLCSSHDPNQTSKKMNKTSFALRMNDRLVEFFKGPVFGFVTHSVTRVVILSVYVCVVATCVYACTTIKLDNETFRLFNSWHEAEIAKHKLRYMFLSNAEEAKVELHVVWGLGLQDRSMCPTKEYNGLYPCEGHTVWDEEFNMQKPETQIALYDFCSELKQTNESALMLSKKGHYNNVTCFIHDMVDYFKEESLKPQYPEGTDFNLPITEKKMRVLMESNSYLFKNDSWRHIHYPFEFALEWWLTDGYTNETITDTRQQMHPYIGLKKMDERNLAKSNGKRIVTYMKTWQYPEIYNKRLMFASIKVVTTVSEWSIGLSEGVKLIDYWDRFLENKTSTWPSMLDGVWQFSPTFVWISVIESLASQAIIAVCVGLLLSFVVILIGTTNLVTALWASSLLASVPICVFAIIPLTGWKFGLPEALNLCLIVGLAVDYIVHIAEGYHMSNSFNRHDRLKDALGSVGISITAGAITTLGSSFFMMLPKLLFFKQFGAFVFTTIALSTLFSLLVFSAGYSIFGPEGQSWSFMKACSGQKEGTNDEALEVDEMDSFLEHRINKGNVETNSISTF